MPGHPAAASLLSRLRYRSDRWMARLAQGEPERLAWTPPDPLRGDAAAGDRIFVGEFALAGETHRSSPEPDWSPAGAGHGWRAEMHGFLWLRDLRAAPGAVAPRRGRLLVDSWLRRHGRWDARSWRADVLGTRVAAWLMNAEFLAEGADEAFRKRLLGALTVQSRHLSHEARRAAGRPGGILALRGLLLSGAALHEGGDRRRLACALMGEALRRLPADPPSLPDGLRTLEALLSIRGALGDRGGAGPVAEAAARLADALSRRAGEGEGGGGEGGSGPEGLGILVRAAR